MKEHIIETDATKEEKEEALKNDKVQTYFGKALDDAEVLGGRYKHVNKIQIVGAGPNAYPRQPPNSPWHDRAVPEYPDPLGYSVEEDK